MTKKSVVYSSGAIQEWVEKHCELFEENPDQWQIEKKDFLKSCRSELSEGNSYILLFPMITQEKVREIRDRLGVNKKNAKRKKSKNVISEPFPENVT